METIKTILNMKHLIKAFLFAAVLSFIASCNTKDDYYINIPDMTTLDVPWSGLNGTVPLETNFNWVAQVVGDAQVHIYPEKGEPGTLPAIIVKENITGNPLAATVVFKSECDCTDLSAVINIKQGVLTEIEHGGYAYKVKHLKDGRYWFVENLRYVPEGKSASLKLDEIANGVWYPLDSKLKTVTDNADTVARKGLLYNVEAALGVAPGSLTVDNAKDYEGARGLCPQGWHIPTLDEVAALVGRVAGSDYDGNKNPKKDAPYYSETDGMALLSLAKADGFNIWPELGYLNVSEKATSATPIAVMSYILSSTAVPRTDGKLTQFYAIMPAKTSGGTCNGALHNYRGGAVVRCIKDL